MSEQAPTAEEYARQIVAANPRGIPHGPAAIHFCPIPGCLDLWESEATCEHAALIPDEEARPVEDPVTFRQATDGAHTRIPSEAP